MSRKTKKTKEKEWSTLEVVALFVIMTICMSAAIFSCIYSIQKISAENEQSDSTILAHMVESGIESVFTRPIVVAETMSNDYSLKQYMKKSASGAPEAVETRVADYLDSIKKGFGYQMVYAVCDQSRAYYTYEGLCKYIDIENDPDDIWYQHFLDKNKSYELEVDTDDTNHWALAVFVNQEIIGENRELLGVCGVGVEMKDVQNRLKWYEIKYNLKIDLVDKSGLILVDSDTARIQRDHIVLPSPDRLIPDDFYYESGSDSSRMTKYMKDLGLYLVVEDLSPDKINVLEITIISIIIFVIGLLMIAMVFFVIFMRERKAAIELIERRTISLTDAMTGLLNRRALEEDCADIQDQGLVAQTTILMMDVNSLKEANDTYGHSAGDELIVLAADCMQTAMGELGKVYRTGGDEFVALLSCSEVELKASLRMLDHLIGSTTCSFGCVLSVSKGVVVCREHGELTFDEMRDLADQRMYEDKLTYYKRTGKKRR